MPAFDSCTAHCATPLTSSLTCNVTVRVADCEAVLTTAGEIAAPSRVGACVSPRPYCVNDSCVGSVPCLPEASVHVTCVIRYTPGIEYRGNTNSTDSVPLSGVPDQTALNVLLVEVAVTDKSGRTTDAEHEDTPATSSVKDHVNVSVTDEASVLTLSGVTEMFVTTGDWVSGFPVWLIVGRGNLARAACMVNELVTVSAQKIWCTTHKP